MEGNEAITIEIKCVPPTATGQTKRAVRTKKGIRFFKGEALAQAESTLDSLFEKYAPTVPLSGPVECTIEATWPYLKSHTSTKATSGRNDPIYHCQKPDGDNFAKGVIDSLARMRFLEDDKQVCDLRVTKWYGPAEKVGIYVRLRAL